MLMLHFIILEDLVKHFSDFILIFRLKRGRGELY